MARRQRPITPAWAITTRSQLAANDLIGWRGERCHYGAGRKFAASDCLVVCCTAGALDWAAVHSSQLHINSLRLSISVYCFTVCTRRPRHQGGAHGGRAPAKLVRAPAKITGLIMFHLSCQIRILVFWGIFGIKNWKRPHGNPVFHGGWSRRLSHTHSYTACHAPETHCMTT